MSHAPSLIRYFSHVTHTSPTPPLLLPLLHSPPLYLLSLAPLLPFVSHSHCTLVSSMPFIFFQRLQSSQWLSEVSISCRLKCCFFLALCSHTTYELKPSCVISRWISLLVALIASAWYEIRYWLHRFEPQSTALLSWIPACNISHRMCTNAKEMCSNI